MTTRVYLFRTAFFFIQNACVTQTKLLWLSFSSKEIPRVFAFLPGRKQPVVVGRSSRRRVRNFNDT